MARKFSELFWRKYGSEDDESVKQKKTLLLRVLKGAWTAFLFVTVLFLAFLLVRLVLTYSQTPVATVVSARAVSQLPLPTVRLCAFETFNRSALVDDGVSERLAHYIEAVLGSPDHMQHTAVDANATSRAHLERQFDDWLGRQQAALGSPDLDLVFTQHFLRSGFQCDQLFAGCSFEGRAFNCCERMRPLLTRDGLCYAISGLVQRQPGVVGMGLRLLTNAVDEGFKLSVYDSAFESEVPEMVFVSAGMSSLLQLRLAELDSYEQKGHCEPQPTQLRMNVYEACSINCTLNEFERACGCVPLRPRCAHRLERPVCTPARALACAEDGASLQGAQSCHARCRHACTRRDYSVSVSSARLHAGEAGGAQLELFYHRLTYTVFAEMQTMPIEQFLANVGGQVSLLLGASVVSIAQAVFFGFISCTGICAKRRVKRDNLTRTKVITFSSIREEDKQ